MIDANLLRWISLSVNKFFDSNKGSYSLYFEGQEITLPTAQVVNSSVSLATVIPASAQQTWAELHVSTLDINEVTANNFEVMMTLTCMATALFTLDDTLLDQIAGYFANLMTGCLPVFKYGINDQDDDSSISSFVPIGKTKTIPWGSVQLTLSEGPLRVKQKSIEQLYRMSIYNFT